MARRASSGADAPPKRGDTLADKLARNEDVQEFYLGAGRSGAHKSMRDVKHYKRRKRWLS